MMFLANKVFHVLVGFGWEQVSDWNFKKIRNISFNRCGMLMNKVKLFDHLSASGFLLGWFKLVFYAE